LQENAFETEVSSPEYEEYSPAELEYEEDEDAIVERTFVFGVGGSMYGIRLYTEASDI